MQLFSVAQPLISVEFFLTLKHLNKNRIKCHGFLHYVLFSQGAPLGIPASEKNVNSTVVIYNSDVVNKDWDLK